MDELRIDGAGDPARDISAVLRVAGAWRLTAQQSTDLDAIVADLERAVRRSRTDRASLVRLNGDLTVLDTTVNRASMTPPVGAKVSPLTRAQRVRIKRLVAALIPKRRGEARIGP